MRGKASIGTRKVALPCFEVEHSGRHFLTFLTMTEDGVRLKAEL